jgi:hypothetical protein
MCACSCVEAALSFVLHAAVDRWHETSTTKLSLREWLAIPEAVWPDYVMYGVTPEVIAALAESAPERTTPESPSPPETQP